MMDQEAREEAISSVPVLGFIGWLTSAVAYVLYLVWAFTPNAVLEAHGISYYPSKYWALAIPTWISVTVVVVYWLYESSNLMMAPSKEWYFENPDDLHSPEESERIPRASNNDGRKGGFQAAPPVYLSVGDEEGILPVVEIPRPIITMMTDGGLSAQEAVSVYQRRQELKG